MEVDHASLGLRHRRDFFGASWERRRFPNVDWAIMCHNE